MKSNAHKIGAVMYVLWGILHVMFGATMLYQLTISGTAALASVATAVPPADLPQDLGGAASGLIAQHAWNLLWFGLFGIYVGWKMNWKNSPTGYWLNLLVISAADLGFIFAILIPGYITIADGIMGPALWLLAVVFSTVGYMGAKNEGPVPSMAA